MPQRLLQRAHLKLWRARHRAVAGVIDEIRAQRLTYLELDPLTELAEVTTTLEEASVEGMIIEAGTALGGSAVLLARCKSPQRALRVYDVFDMIPEPGERDGEDVHERSRVIRAGDSKGIQGDKYYGYEDNLYAKVSQTFVEFGVDREAAKVELIKGLFEDTMVIDGPVALAHIDCDWYDSVMTCLQRIVDHLVPGGRLVIDDYYRWSGCKTAVDEYFADKGDAFEFRHLNRLHIIKR